MVVGYRQAQDRNADAQVGAVAGHGWPAKGLPHQRQDSASEPPPFPRLPPVGDRVIPLNIFPISYRRSWRGTSAAADATKPSPASLPFGSWRGLVMRDSGDHRGIYCWVSALTRLSPTLEIALWPIRSRTFAMASSTPAAQLSHAGTERAAGWPGHWQQNWSRCETPQPGPTSSGGAGPGPLLGRG